MKVTKHLFQKLNYSYELHTSWFPLPIAISLQLYDNQQRCILYFYHELKFQNLSDFEKQQILERSILESLDLIIFLDLKLESEWFDQLFFAKSLAFKRQ